MSQYAPKKPSVVNSFSVTLTLILLVGGYFGWWYLPHWFKAWRMSGVLVSVGNDAYRQYDDNKLMAILVKEGKRLGLNVSEDNFAIQRVPYTADELSGVVSSIPAKRGKMITIAFAQTVVAEWPLVGGSRELTFEYQATTDLAAVAY